MIALRSLAAIPAVDGSLLVVYQGAVGAAGQGVGGDNAHDADCPAT